MDLYDDDKDVNNGDEEEVLNPLRSSSRVRKTSCPFCGEFFIDIETHVLNCQPELEDPPLKEKIMMMTTPPVTTTTTTTNKKRGKDSSPAADIEKRFKLPPDLEPPPPELEENKSVIERERMLYAAAAAAANCMPNNSSVNNELFEVEPGVVILASSDPFIDNQGTGMIYTLNQQISWLVQELHSLRDSDGFIRKQNAELRAEYEQLKKLFEGISNTMKKEDVEKLERELVQCKAELESQIKIYKIARSDLESIKQELTQNRNELETSKSECTKFKTQSTKSKTELNKLKKENENCQIELAQYQAELVLARQELEEKRILLENLQNTISPYEDQNVEEYCNLLLNWITTHNNALLVSALAVFHGVKPRAKLLWKELSKKYTLKDFVCKFAMDKGLIFMDDEDASSIMYVPTAKQPLELINNNGKSNEDEEILDFRDFLFTSSETNTEETNFIGRVMNKKRISWLEENNGYGTWNEYLETFPNTTLKTKEEFQKSIESQRETLFLVPASKELGENAIVLKSFGEIVLCNLLCKYLKLNGSSMLGSKFAHFVETFPGALQVKERVGASEGKLASLAKKFPEKIHFWREGDTAWCCLAEEREKLEKEKAEKKRREMDSKQELERLRIEREKKIAEERANLDWERKREVWKRTQDEPKVASSRWGDTSTSTNLPGGVAPVTYPPPSYPAPPSSATSASNNYNYPPTPVPSGTAAPPNNYSYPPAPSAPLSSATGPSSSNYNYPPTSSTPANSAAPSSTNYSYPPNTANSSSNNGFTGYPPTASGTNEAYYDPSATQYYPPSSTDPAVASYYPATAAQAPPTSSMDQSVPSSAYYPQTNPSHYAPPPTDQSSSYYPQTAPPDQSGYYMQQQQDQSNYYGYSQQQQQPYYPPPPSNNNVQPLLPSSSNYQQQKGGYYRRN